MLAWVCFPKIGITIMILYQNWEMSIEIFPKMGIFMTKIKIWMSAEKLL